MKKAILILLIIITEGIYSQEKSLADIYKGHIEIQKSILTKKEINDLPGKLIILIPRDTIIDRVVQEDTMKYYIPYVTNEEVVKVNTNKTKIEPTLLMQGLFDYNQILPTIIARFLVPEMVYNDKAYIIIEETIKSEITSEINKINFDNAIETFKKKNPQISKNVIFAVIKKAKIVSINYDIIVPEDRLLSNLNFTNSSKLRVEIQLSEQWNEQLIRDMIEKTKKAHPENLDKIFSYKDYLKFNSKDKEEIDMRVLTILSNFSFPNEYKGSIK